LVLWWVGYTSSLVSVRFYLDLSSDAWLNLSPGQTANQYTAVTHRRYSRGQLLPPFPSVFHLCASVAKPPLGGLVAWWLGGKNPVHPVKTRPSERFSLNPETFPSLQDGQKHFRSARALDFKLVARPHITFTCHIPAQPPSTPRRASAPSLARPSAIPPRRPCTMPPSPNWA
jgi:hypothetical protein